jgi:hypothetical protein
MFLDDGDAVDASYTHFRPPIVHRRHDGFASSHLTRRALANLLDEREYGEPVRDSDLLASNAASPDLGRAFSRSLWCYYWHWSYA